MKVLITGSGGQLGWELIRAAPPAVCMYSLARNQLDVTDRAQVEQQVRGLCPEVVINAAAYTAVDTAEAEPEQAYAVNAIGAENVATVAAAAGISLIHISTDFVFSGSKASPYLPTDVAQPLSVYGASKLEGERRILRIPSNNALIVRTSWMYSIKGRNFVKTMLHLLEERETLDVVDDQIGTPTWARGLAEALWEMALLGYLRGVYHWSDAGVASWYDLAVAVAEYGYELGLLTRPASITPVRTIDYPLPAKRPAMSVLDKTASWRALKRPPLHWRQTLKMMLSELSP
ncbi:MAG: dTDP-4-dehydrorhamnose reductase [Deltaproteobacteria bacterium]|nr:dTDP-4-dehydrorhamnose reductase [Deltaproteobacteria bacterium]